MPVFVIGEIKKISDETITVYWHSGYRGKDKCDDELLKEETMVHLGRVEPGTIFRGLLKAYPDRIKWIKPPYILNNKKLDWDSIPKAKFKEKSN